MISRPSLGSKLADSSSDRVQIARPPLNIFVIHLVTIRTRSGPVLTGGGGGGLIHCIQLVEEWTRLGNRVTVLTNVPAMFQGKCARIEEIGRSGPNLNSARSESLLQPIRTSLSALTSLHKEIKFVHVPPQEHSRSVAVAASQNIPDIAYALRIARRTRIPVVVTFHHLFPPPWWYPGRRGGVVRCTGAWLMSQLALLVTKIWGLAPSIDQVRILAESGWRFPGPILRDEIFLDDRSLVPPKGGEARPIDACIICRLSPNKGINDLIMVWNEVLRRLPSAKLVIGGDFESTRLEREFIKAREDQKLTKSITIRGHLTSESKRELLSASKLFVYPSYEEGWSMAVMEAAACGCVPVLYDLPAYDYLGPLAQRVPTGNREELADRIVKLLGDSRTREDSARKLKDASNSYSVKRTAQSHLDYFQELLDRVAKR